MVRTFELEEGDDDSEISDKIVDITPVEEEDDKCIIISGDKRERDNAGDKDYKYD